MKRFLYTFLIFVFVFNMTALAAVSPSIWAEDEFDDARRAGIIPESIHTSPKTYPVTRAQFCELVMLSYEKAAGVKTEDIINGASPFTDTDDPYISAAYHLGIVSGVGGGLFLPDRLVQRQEAAKMMYLLNEAVTDTYMPSPARALRGFSDEADIADWAREYVAAMYNANIMLGNADGTFAPAKSTSAEQSVLMVMRLIAPKPQSDVVITEDDLIEHSPKNELTLSFETENEAPYSVLLTDPYSGHEVRLVTDKKSVTLSKNTLKEDGVYSVFAEANGVYSKPVTVTTSPSIKTMHRLTGYELAFAWSAVPGADEYTVTVTEQRRSYYPDAIPKNAPFAYTFDRAGSFCLTLNPNRIYTVTVSAAGQESSFAVTTDPVSTDEERRAEIFPDGEFTTREEAEAHMQAVEVPIWTLSDGKKTASSTTVVVHRELSDKVLAVFEEIFNGPEKFVFNSVGGYNWRTTNTSSRLSEHALGTAIDINPNENWCVYKNGTTVGSYWKPYEDPYSVTPYGDVVKAFEKHGFVWGGDAWSSPQDYMHFSYLGT